MNLKEIKEREIFPGFKGKFVHGKKLPGYFGMLKKVQ